MNKYLAEIMEIKAQEYNCAVCDFTRENKVLYIENETVLFTMITFGLSTVITGRAPILNLIKKELKDTDSINLFDAPSLYVIDSILHDNGSSLSEINDFFIPSDPFLLHTKKQDLYEVRLLEKDDIIKNSEDLCQFDNALCLDEYIQMNELAFAAYDQKKVISIAGTSSNSKYLWWIGVDTISAYRRKGLASRLVNYTAHEVIKKGKIPVYPTWYSNISSRLTAIKAGFIPGFVEIENE